MSELVVVQPGKPVGEAVRDSIQQTAQAKQLLEMKKQVTAKLSNVINALMQSFAIDPDNAASTALGYSVALSMGSGTSKEDFLAGVEKVWVAQAAQAEEVKDEQRKMLLNVAKNVMDQQKPIPPPLLGQMQAIGCVIPEDLQKWIDNPPASPGA